MPKFCDLTGQKFNRLTAIRSDRKDRWGKYLWICKCECGGQAETTSFRLKSGHTMSCGCIQEEFVASLNKTHGKSKSREHSIWTNMKSRCLNPNSTEYKRYGARGITICDRWSQSFLNFINDMGACPEKFSIERIDNGLGYFPENCKWADSYEQGSNKRNNFMIHTPDGVFTASQAARKYNRHRTTFLYREKHGLPILGDDFRKTRKIAGIAT